MRLEDRLPKFKQIVFHEKLGTQAERIERIERLAARAGADRRCRSSRRRSAPRGSAKADLLTEVVGEFPELQGLMGKYYALAQGEDEASRVPSRSTTSRTGRPTGCRPIRCRSRSRSPTRSTRWSASGRSTRSRPGQKDPYALRRAALGVIRIVLENELRLPLLTIVIATHF